MECHVIVGFRLLLRLFFDTHIFRPLSYFIFLFLFLIQLYLILQDLIIDKIYLLIDLLDFLLNSHQLTLLQIMRVSQFMLLEKQLLVQVTQALYLLCVVVLVLKLLFFAIIALLLSLMKVCACNLPLFFFTDGLLLF